jgi:Zn-finger nucleic acid-binding protein
MLLNVEIKSSMFGGNVYEVEGCIDCRSIWFDCRELDLFVNKIVSFGDDEVEVLPVPEYSGGAGGAGSIISFIMGF